VLGYVAMMEASVDVSPVALAGTLSGLASRAGASEVRLSRFRTADPRAAQQRAMAAAVANGQEQAQAIAAASGAKLGRLVRVSDQNGGYA
uniref:SIMPL domain-containing protein n=5 Tax=Pseudomonadota TaxID=1224 RepID=UPI0013D825BE